MEVFLCGARYAPPFSRARIIALWMQGCTKQGESMPLLRATRDRFPETEEYVTYFFGNDKKARKQYISARKKILALATKIAETERTFWLQVLGADNATLKRLQCGIPRLSAVYNELGVDGTEELRALAQKRIREYQLLQARETLASLRKSGGRSQSVTRLLRRGNITPEEIGTTKEELREFDRTVVLQELAEAKVHLKLGEPPYRSHRFRSSSSVTSAMRRYSISAEELTAKEAEEYDHRRTSAMMTMKNFLAQTRDALTSHKKGYGVNWPSYGYVSWENERKAQGTLVSILNIKKDVGKYDLTLEEIGSTEAEATEMKAYIEAIISEKTKDQNQ